MIKYFLRHQWLQFKRSASYDRELGLSIILGIIILLGVISFVALAFALPSIITKIPGVTDPIFAINQAMILFFISELFMRYFLQKVPVLDIQPYLGLPIKRNMVSRFLIGKSLLSIFNLMSLTLTLPMAVQTLKPQFGVLGITGWLICIFSISLCLHFFNILFKKRLEDLPIVWVILIVIVAGNYISLYFFQFDLFNPLSSALASVLRYPIFSVIPLVLALTLMLITIRFFNQNLYLEEIGKNNAVQVENYSEMFRFLGRSGLSNALILQEIRLILRHKRSRSALILSVLFVFYGLMFFGKNDTKMHLFVGVFMSGLFTINYGQFFWSWNTNQLDFYMTKPIALQTWVMSRYRLLATTTILSTLLAVPYVYFGWEVLLAIVASWIYNLGINIPFMMRLSLWSPKAIDLNKSSIMNYEGAGAAQWIMAFPLFLGPYVVYIPVNIFFGHIEGLCAVAILGFIGLALRDYFIKFITRQIQSRKYQLIHDLTI